jgi:predicted HicB family RNase H-like nuclease
MAKGKQATEEKAGEVWVQLATRLPKALHRALKMHCVSADVAIMSFIIEAITDRLANQGKKTVRK